jgi:hypothetical protein
VIATSCPRDVEIRRDGLVRDADNLRLTVQFLVRRIARVEQFCAKRFRQRFGRNVDNQLSRYEGKLSYVRLQWRTGS